MAGVTAVKDKKKDEHHREHFVEDGHFIKDIHIKGNIEGSPSKGRPRISCIPQIKGKIKTNKEVQKTPNKETWRSKKRKKVKAIAENPHIVCRRNRFKYQQ